MNLNVVIAPDSFKGSLAAREVAAAIARGWRRQRPADHLIQLPQADGGEGTLDAIEAAVAGSVRRDAGMVPGPDGRPTPGMWLELPGGTAVVELAQCSGLPLMASLDPLHATTRGLGEVIRRALESGADSLVIGLGGSASTDGGAGALSALGLDLRDSRGQRLPDGGGRLADVAQADRTGLLPPPPRGVTLLTDVSARLLGPTGAAAVFGPQKGASPDEVLLLDAALERFSTVLGGHPEQHGAGAAGGTAYGFAAAWGARIEPGAAYLQELSGLTRAIRNADVVLSGEGRFDATSVSGKVVGEVIRLARANAVAVGVIAGQVAVTNGPWTAELAEIAGSAELAMEDPVSALEEAGRRAAVHFGR